MKLSETKLRKIIKEEIRKLNERMKDEPDIKTYNSDELIKSINHDIKLIESGRIFQDSSNIAKDVLLKIKQFINRNYNNEIIHWNDLDRFMNKEFSGESLEIAKIIMMESWDYRD